MAEEMIDVEVNLGKEQAAKINKMTKKELIEHFVVMCLRNKVQDETAAELERENTKLQENLDKAESYVEQGRAMIGAITEGWYHYD